MVTFEQAVLDARLRIIGTDIVCRVITRTDILVEVSVESTQRVQCWYANEFGGEQFELIVEEKKDKRRRMKSVETVAAEAAAENLGRGAQKRPGR